MSESIYDAELSKLIELKTLTWLPWIGENYAGSPSDKKILLIGESHYYGDEDDKKWSEKGGFTREIIQDVIKGNHTHPFFRNSMRLLALSNDKKAKFWSNIAFYNFIQKPVEKNTRPVSTDFNDGWSPFFDLIKVINPSVCIFLGASAAQQFSRANQILKRNVTLSKDKKINGAWARSGTFSSDKGNIELVFIKHPSSRFSNDLWRKYLEKRISPQLEWLKDSINT